MARRSYQAPNRRNSQQAPYPGAGAQVQNAALSAALSPGMQKLPANGQLNEDGPPRVIPSPVNQTMPAESGLMPMPEQPLEAYQPRMPRAVDSITRPTPVADKPGAAAASSAVSSVPSMAPAAPATPNYAADPSSIRGAGWNAGSIPGAGYNAENWGTNSGVKYVASEILSRYPATPSGVAAAMNDPDWKRLFPGATFDGKDRIDFGDTPSDFVKGGPRVGIVDVLLSADREKDTAAGLWWGNDPGFNGLASAGPVGSALGLGGAMQAPSSPENFNYQQLIAYLMQQLGI